MKTQHTSIIILLLAMLLSIPLSAQKMTVESMVHTPLDQTANLSENTYKDNNGEYGGLVKVKLAASGASFEGWVLKQQVHNTSEYWVFMAKGGSRLSVIVPGYLPLEVNFRDYDDCIIQSLHTYVLTITLPGGPVVVDDGMRYLAMVVKPKNATVLVDGDPQMLDENGELVVRLSKGTHRYQVSAVGYEPKEGNVEVGDNNAPLNVSLASNQATLRVECPTNGAEIFVNGQLKGKAPWSGSFMPGQYLVEARLNGYRTGQQSVSLKGKEDRLVSIPKLEQVYGILDVNCRPVGSEVYVDGVKVGTSPNTFRNVPVGERRIEVRKEGYQTMEKTVIIRESGKTEVPGTLVVASGSQGGDAVSTQGPSSTSVTSVPSAPSSPDKETFTVNGVSFTMVRVEGGTFTMGKTDEQGSDASYNEKPAHEVTLSTYMIGETEVTQALWQAVMGANPSKFQDSPENPVECVSWLDCKNFILRLNEITGKTFRLPTEAEWEFASRGGVKSSHYKYSGSNNLDEVAWFWENSGVYHLSGSWSQKKIEKNYCKTHPVKLRFPNELGLFDMSGNVWEWCEDWYKDNYFKSSPKSNPKGPSFGSFRVYRGGSWDYISGCCRVSSRYGHAPDSGFNFLGLRLAL